jgi:mevalonate pyrophosphate decarboxylase
MATGVAGSSASTAAAAASELNRDNEATPTDIRELSRDRDAR